MKMAKISAGEEMMVDLEGGVMVDLVVVADCVIHYKYYRSYDTEHSFHDNDDGMIMMIVIIA